MEDGLKQSSQLDPEIIENTQQEVVIESGDNKEAAEEKKPEWFWRSFDLPNNTELVLTTDGKEFLIPENRTKLLDAIREYKELTVKDKSSRILGNGYSALVYNLMDNPPVAIKEIYSDGEEVDSRSIINRHERLVGMIESDGHCPPWLHLPEYYGFLRQKDGKPLDNGVTREYLLMKKIDRAISTKSATNMQSISAEFIENSGLSGKIDAPTLAEKAKMKYFRAADYLEHVASKNDLALDDICPDFREVNLLIQVIESGDNKLSFEALLIDQ